MSYRGKFKPTNIAKYNGDHTKVIYRSLWERQVYRWLDTNPDILKWSSEEIIIPYLCKSDGKMHRYFPDINFRTRDGTVYLIEIKPAKETVPPPPPKRKTRRFIKEVMTYAKNTSKWEAAVKYAEERGWIFEVWTEHVIKGMGIKLLT
jgi:hypothetical protein